MSSNKKKDESLPSSSQIESGSGSGFSRKPVVRTTSLDRLPSLRPKRDLTLGGVRKKSFVPTIPTSRRIKKEPENLESAVGKRDEKHKSSKKKDFKQGRGQRKGKEVITSASVFSMGPADRGIFGRKGSAPSGGSSQSADDLRFMKKPSSTTSNDNKIKTESYLQDMDDQQDEPTESVSIDKLFSNSGQPPVLLPLDHQLHTQRKVVAPKKVKVVKDEPMDYTDPSTVLTECADSKETESLMLANSVVASSAQVDNHQFNVADLFTPTDPSRGQFLFFQLPDRLPTSKGQQSMEEDSKGSQESSSVSASNEKGSATNSNEKVTRERHHCSLQDMPEGLIGKLRVHKSGRVILTLGNVSFNVSMGTPCGFLQELACVRKEKPQPKITVLGQLSHRLVCTLDFEAMLNQYQHSNT